MHDSSLKDCKISPAMHGKRDEWGTLLSLSKIAGAYIILYHSLLAHGLDLYLVLIDVVPGCLNLRIPSAPDHAAIGPYSIDLLKLKTETLIRQAKSVLSPY
jgi:hypothetical protein